MGRKGAANIQTSLKKNLVCLHAALEDAARANGCLANTTKTVCLFAEQLTLGRCEVTREEKEGVALWDLYQSWQRFGDPLDKAYFLHYLKEYELHCHEDRACVCHAPSTQLAMNLEAA